jgi:hypothetical protein
MGHSRLTQPCLRLDWAIWKSAFTGTGSKDQPLESATALYLLAPRDQHFGRIAGIEILSW